MDFIMFFEYDMTGRGKKVTQTPNQNSVRAAVAKEEEEALASLPAAEIVSEPAPSSAPVPIVEL
jgi:hypothetical protein